MQYAGAPLQKARHTRLIHTQWHRRGVSPRLVPPHLSRLFLHQETVASSLVNAKKRAPLKFLEHYIHVNAQFNLIHPLSVFFSPLVEHLLMPTELALVAV